MKGTGWWLIVMVVVLALVAGCESAPSLPNPLARPTPTPTATPTATPTPAPSEPSAPDATPTPATVDLVWWTPVWFSPQSQDPAGEFLAERIAQFEAEHPTIRVHALVKPPYGKGGIKDYLQGAYKVAPGLLPDLVAVDMRELFTLSSLGIFQPLDELLSPEATEDLYLVAREAGVVNEAWLAIQFEANFYHLTYYREDVPTPPSTWEALLNGEATYLSLVFSSDEEVSDVVLLQYAASGGELPLRDTVPLNDQALFSLYSFYDQAFRRGIIPETALSPLKADTLWDALQKREAAMVDTSARRYLREGVQRVEVGAAPIPTWDGKPRVLASGWGLAVTTAVPERQAAAVALMEWLLAPETLGPWSQSAGRIPTRPGALARWDVPAPYQDMLNNLLENAIPYPAHTSLSTLRRALTVGMKAMLLEGESPENAVRRAQEAYSP